MPDKQSKLSNYLMLFMPSPLSAVLCVSLAGATLVLNQIEFIREYLRLPNSLEVLRTVASWADMLLTGTLGESKTSVIVVGAFWALVGLGVYMFLRGLARYISELDDDIAVRRYVWPKGANRDKPLIVTIERTAFRVAVLIALAVVVFGPLADTLKGPVLLSMIGSNVIVHYAAWFVASLLLWHLAVVLLRLVFLRARVFGE